MALRKWVAACILETHLLLPPETERHLAAAHADAVRHTLQQIDELTGGGGGGSAADPEPEPEPSDGDRDRHRDQRTTEAATARAKMSIPPVPQTKKKSQRSRHQTVRAQPPRRARFKSTG